MTELPPDSQERADDFGPGKAKLGPPPKQRSRFLPALSALVVALVCIGVAYLLTERPWKARYAPPPGELVRAIGGQWIAETPEFTWLGDNLRVRTTFYPVRVTLEDVTGRALINSFCGALLSYNVLNKHGHQRMDVYRVEINFVLPIDGVVEPQWPNHLSVAVKAGSCQILPEGEDYFPRYPGALMDWELLRVDFKDGGASGVFSFAPVRGAEAEPSAFSYQEACNAVLQDQPFVSVLESDPKTRGLLAEIERVTIKRETPLIRSRFVKLGGFVGYEFRRAGSICVDGEPVDI